MGDEVKKISFGFTKLVKKSCIVSSKLNEAKPEEKKIEFIDCLEGKSIKLKDPVKPKDTILVIPLTRQQGDDSKLNSELDTITIQSTYTPSDSEESSGLVKKLDSVLNCKDDTITSSEATTLSINPARSETLDEIAAREILEDLSRQKMPQETRMFNVPLTSNAPTGEKESSLEDYDNIPVGEFGMAMLRGMGWAPGKGIGKNEKLVTPAVPTLRPKGMGLGADSVIKSVNNSNTASEDLKMIKGSFIRVIAGPHKDSYGQIEGFDDESGRMIVKLALKNESVSLNEFMVQLVNKMEFTKNSKVINVGKYEKYKVDEDKESNEMKSEKVLKEEKNNENYDDRSAVIGSKLKSEKYSRQHSNSSESEHSCKEKSNIKVRKSSPPRKSTNKSYKRRSKSSSISSDESNVRNRHSRSPAIRKHEKKRSCKEPSISRHISRSSSRGTSSSSDYSKKSKNRTKKKKPSSHKRKSRSRSRSPRKHGSHKKHKKSKY